MRKRAGKIILWIAVVWFVITTFAIVFLLGMADIASGQNEYAGPFVIDVLRADYDTGEYGVWRSERSNRIIPIDWLTSHQIARRTIWYAVDPITGNPLIFVSQRNSIHGECLIVLEREYHE